MKPRPSSIATLLARTFGLRAPLGALATFGACAAYGVPLAGTTAAALLLLARGVHAAARAGEIQRALRRDIERLDALLRAAQQDHTTLKAEFAHAQHEAAQTARASAMSGFVDTLQRARGKILACAHALSDGLDHEPASIQPLRGAAEAFALVAHDALDNRPLLQREIVLDETAVDLRELIDSVALLVAPVAARRQVRLQMCIDRSVAARVLTDRARLAQVVFDLLAYAIEMSGQRAVTLSARAESLNGGAQRIVIGITAAPAAADAEPRPSRAVDRPAVMESPDVREHPDLALARVIAQKMGGDITILEGRNVGVCIALHAPFTIERHEWPVHGHERRWARVDLDDYADRQAICELLRKLGITTLPADATPPVRIDYRFVEAGCGPSAHGEARRIVVTRDALPGGMRERDGGIELSLNPLSWTALRRICEAPADAANAPATRAVPLQAQARPASRSPEVLVVDDNDVNRKVLARQLDVLGCRCVSASSGDEALDMLSRASVDLMITDLQMPGMNGVELARRVHAASGDSARALPIVLLSANSDTKLSDADRSLFGAILVKTSGLNALDGALARLLPASARHAAASPMRLEKHDFTALDSLAAQGVDVDGLLRDWQRSMEDDLADLAQHRASGDEQGTRRALHKLAGALGIVGNRGLMTALQRASAGPEHADEALLDGLVERTRMQMSDLAGSRSRTLSDAEDAR